MSSSEEDEVLKVLRYLKEEGVIRRIGAVLEPRKLGFEPVLLAFSVGGDRLEEVGSRMAGYSQVTHCYQRDGSEYNLWVVAVERKGYLEGLIRELADLEGVRRALVLKCERPYKLATTFGREGVLGPTTVRTSKKVEGPPPLRLLRSLSDIPLVRRPFLEIAEGLGMSEGEVIARTEKLVNFGLVRRFGAVLDHAKVGFSENALVLWGTEEPNELGVTFAKLPWVSHCYLRKAYAIGPPSSGSFCGVYTMVHARSRRELKDRISRMREVAGAEPSVFYTLRCFKKGSFEPG
ncbi:MAG TPA: Lrp/AsnC family transcriptional regulator [Candidatus Latescibacteria bacterium]|nr:Lrp/AsnC family transcriptional regulator [Candidatus Latescibacterota bacterium]